MGFMSSRPSLDGTLYTETDLRTARIVWANVEQRYLPGWFESSESSCLAALFHADSQYTACVLIELAMALDAVHRNLTSKSLPIFKAKMQSLLKAKEEKKFDELKTEIFVAATIAPSISPIAFEPYVPARKSISFITRLLHGFTNVTWEQPGSPDYAVSLPDGPVIIEVTVLYVGQFERWQTQVNGIRDILAQKIGARNGIYRDLHLELPVEFQPSMGNKLCQRHVTEEIIRKEHGELELAVGAASAHVRWRPMPIYERADFKASAVPADVSTCIISDGASVGNGFGFNARPILTRERFAELMLGSLRNTLERKRDQFHKRDTRYVLVIKLGHHWLKPEALHDLFEVRIWPNRAYDWVTAFSEFRPRQQYIQGSSGPLLTTQLNPNAIASAGSLLEAALNGRKKFHMFNDNGTGICLEPSRTVTRFIK